MLLNFLDEILDDAVGFAPTTGDPLRETLCEVDETTKIGPVDVLGEGSGLISLSDAIARDWGPRQSNKSTIACDAHPVAASRELVT